MTEMSTVTGVIENKQRSWGTKKTGEAWTKFTIKVAGVIMSTFDLLPFENGENVKVTYSTKGIYNTIEDIQLVQAKDKATEGVKYSDDSLRQMLIVRQSCNQRAIEFLELLHKTQPEHLASLLKEKALLDLVDSVSAHFENKVWAS